MTSIGYPSRSESSSSPVGLKLSESDQGTRGAASKVLAVLIAFTRHEGSASLAELAQLAQLPKSTTHRMVGFLREAGLVEVDGGRCHLGTQVCDLADAVPARLPARAREVLLACLTDLYDATHEVVQLVVPGSGTAEVAERLHGRKSVDLATRLGMRFPLHCTAAGKIFLAERQTPGSRTWGRDEDGLTLAQFTPATITSHVELACELARVRATGLAHDRGEWKHGIIGVAAPVLDSGRTAVAAISVMGYAGRLRPQVVAEHVRRIAHLASRELNALGRSARRHHDLAM